MATMILCPTCKKKISSDATACPKCGQPIDDKAREEGIKQAKSAKTGCLLIILILAAIGVYGSMTRKEAPSTPAISPNQASSVTPSQNEKPTPKNNTLGVSYADFIIRFNKTAKEAAVPFSLKMGTIESGAEYNSSTISPVDYLSILFSLTKDNQQVRNVTIATIPKTPQASIAAIGAMASLIAAVDPELRPKDRGDIFKKIGLAGEKIDLTDHNASTIKGKNKYFVAANQSIGLFFGAEPAE